MTAYRTGLGWDVHPLTPGRQLILGGVAIPSELGLAGHSDADVLAHAITDAILGGLALGDIGMHFPDTDPRWRGADSARFVRHARTLLADRDYRIVNADLTLLAQSPKIAPWRDAMRDGVADLLEIERACVNIKATTPEHLGFLGRKEGLAAMASVLLELGS